MKKAFTLIELLVVISILAILGALIIPALSRAKLRSKQKGPENYYQQQAPESAPATKVNFCGSCGTKVSGSYCTSCGRKVN